MGTPLYFLIFSFFQVFSTVELAMDVAKTFICYVGVDLGTRDTAVAKKFLDGSNVNALI